MSDAPRHWWTDRMQRLARMPRALGALVALSLLAASCAFGPFVTALEGGLLTQALAAGRYSLVLALAAGVTALLLGLASGAAAGYAAQGAHGAAARAALSGLLPLALLLAALAQTHPDATLALAAAGALGWLQAARVARREARSLQARPFVDAARLASLPPAAIVWRHLVPNLLGAAALVAAFAIPQALLVEAVLGFFGYGLVTPPGWGALLRDGVTRWPASPWPLLAPAGLLALAVASAHQFAVALRRALEP